MKTKLIKMVQVLRIINKIQKQKQARNPSAIINATRLWNVIDYMEDPDVFWQFMQGGLPWAFEDFRDANSIKFAYRRLTNSDLRSIAQAVAGGEA